MSLVKLVPQMLIQSTAWTELEIFGLRVLHSVVRQSGTNHTVPIKHLPLAYAVLPDSGRILPNS